MGVRMPGVCVFRFQYYDELSSRALVPCGIRTVIPRRLEYLTSPRLLNEGNGESEQRDRKRESARARARERPLSQVLRARLTP